MSKRAVTYSRVSGDDSKNDYLNIDNQVIDCRDYTISKGYHLIDEIAEDPKTSTSGADINLPQLSKVRNLAAQGAFDVLIVREIDRLSRNLAKQLIVEQELKSHGVEIEYVLAEYEDSPEGRLNKHVRATIAEYEREKIKERMTRGKRNKVKAGSVMISHVRPFGYQIAKDDKGNGTLIIDETEAPIIVQIFKWYLSGEYSIKAIAKKLSELKVPTVFDTLPNRTRKKQFGTWNDSSVRNILGYETYATGQWGYSKTKLVNIKGKKRKRATDKPENIITVAVPTIIDLETFNLAQEQMRINAKKNKRNRKYEYLMAGRAICGHCLGAMQGSGVNSYYKGNKRTYFYYSDPGASHRNLRSYDCDNRANFPVHIIDNEVWAYVLALFNDPKILEKDLLEQLKKQNQDTSPLREQLAITENLITEHTKRLNELVSSIALLGNSKRAKQAIADQIEQAELTLDKLETEKAKTQGQIADQSTLTEDNINDLVQLAKDFRKEINEVTDFETKRKIIQTLDVRVTLWSNFPDAPKGKRPKPDMTCKITCILSDTIGDYFLSIKSNKTCFVDYNRQKNNGIVLTYTFNLKSPQYSIAA